MRLVLKGKRKAKEGESEELEIQPLKRACMCMWSLKGHVRLLALDSLSTWFIVFSKNTRDIRSYCPATKKKISHHFY